LSWKNRKKGYEVLAAVVMNVAIFRDIALCRPCLSPGSKISQARKPSVAGGLFLVWLIFDPEYIGDTFL
jgi:hypothetical protein